MAAAGAQASVHLLWPSPGMDGWIDSTAPFRKEAPFQKMAVGGHAAKQRGGRREHPTHPFKLTGTGMGLPFYVLFIIGEAWKGACLSKTLCVANVVPLHNFN